VVHLLDEALVRLTSAGAKVVLTSGNHDSAIRLGFAARLLERGGVHLRTRVENLDEPLLLPLGADRAGKEAVLAIYGIPWLEPRLVAGQLGVQTASHFEVTQAATRLIREDIERRAATSTVHPVVLAHTFASGGISSDSERDLSIGGVGAVPLDLFEGFSYTALGHLHGRQALSPEVRYSGSPLAYSFSEARHRKGAWLVDIGADGVKGVDEVLFEAPRTLAVLRGPLQDLLESPEHGWAETAYCQITLTDAQRPARAMDRLRARFPDTLVLGFDPQGGTAASAATYSSRLAEAPDDLAVCCGFLEHVRGRVPDTAEQAALAAALENVRYLERSR
jgi:exonuclease SbcD